LDDVRARLEIGVVNLADDVGTREHQEVVVALEVVRMIAQPLAAKLRLCQPITLNHRPHRAIEQEDAPGEQLVKAGGRRHRALLAPLAISTANGSPALLAPTLTRTSARPESRSSDSRRALVNPRWRSPNRLRTQA